MEFINYLGQLDGSRQSFGQPGELLLDRGGNLLGRRYIGPSLVARCDQGHPSTGIALAPGPARTAIHCAVDRAGNLRCDLHAQRPSRAGSLAIASDLDDDRGNGDC